ncbi:hypothetical protein Nmel_004226 [Mimus melanotis]
MTWSCEKVPQVTAAHSRPLDSTSNGIQERKSYTSRTLVEIADNNSCLVSKRGKFLLSEEGENTMVPRGCLLYMKISV